VGFVLTGTQLSHPLCTPILVPQWSENTSLPFPRRPPRSTGLHRSREGLPRRPGAAAAGAAANPGAPRGAEARQPPARAPSWACVRKQARSSLQPSLPPFIPSASRGAHSSSCTRVRPGRPRLTELGVPTASPSARTRGTFSDKSGSNKVGLRTRNVASGVKAPFRVPREARRMR